MSAHMKKHHTEKENFLRIQHAGIVYQFPIAIAAKYRITESDESSVASASLFKTINEKYTKPGALLRGLRIRENLTQVELAEQLVVTQSDISQMENGTRKIGRKVALRLAKLFDVNYRSFLS